MSNTICLCAVLAGLGTCTGVLWELVYAREKIYGPAICLLVLTKGEKVTLQVILGARPLPSAGFYSSTLALGREPTLPTIEVMAFKSSKAMVPAIRPTKQLSISRAFLLCWLTIRHQKATRIYWCLDSWRFWVGYKIMLPLSMLVLHSERVAISSLSAPAISCLPSFGCALFKMNMASACLWNLQGITTWGQTWHHRFARVVAV